MRVWAPVWCSIAGEFERHWIEIAHRDVFLPGLPQAFDGFRIAQLSDIHLDEYMEPFLVGDAVHHINSMNPDAVFLTGDFVTKGILPTKFASRFGVAMRKSAQPA